MYQRTHGHDITQNKKNKICKFFRIKHLIVSDIETDEWRKKICFYE